MINGVYYSYEQRSVAWASRISRLLINVNQVLGDRGRTTERTRELIPCVAVLTEVLPAGIRLCLDVIRINRGYCSQMAHE